MTRKAFVGSWGGATSQQLSCCVPGTDRVVVGRGDHVIVWVPGRGARCVVAVGGDVVALDADRSRVAAVYVDKSTGSLFLATLKYLDDGRVEDSASFPLATNVVAVALGSGNRILYADEEGIWARDDSNDDPAIRVWNGSSTGRLHPSPDSRHLAFRTSESVSIMCMKAPTLQLKSSFPIGGPTATMEWCTDATLRNALFVYSRGFATLYIELADGGFVAVSRYSDILGASFIVMRKRRLATERPVADASNGHARQTRLLWVATVDNSGHLIITCVDGAFIQPRPVVRVLEFYRISLPGWNHLDKSLFILHCSACFSRPCSWESPPSDVAPGAMQPQPETVFATGVDIDGRIDCESISVPDRIVSRLTSTGGHVAPIRDVQCSKDLPFVASRDDSGRVVIWQMARLHPLSPLEFQSHGEGLLLVADFPGPFQYLYWHPCEPALFTVRQAVDCVSVCILSRSSNGRWTVTPLEGVQNGETFVGLRVVKKGSQPFLAVVYRNVVVIYSVPSSTPIVRHVSELAAPEPIDAFDFALYDDGLLGGLCIGSGRNLKFWSVSMTDWQWTEHPVSRTLSDPIVDIAFDPLADRIAVLSGVTITVWEVDPTAPSLRFVHSLESQSSYLRWADLGDCLLRLVSVDRASDTSLSVKMHMPNRDHVLRDHEFMSLRWQTIEARVDLPHPLLSGRQITALACSQSGTLLIAAGRYMVVVESMLSGDSITSIMPVPVYHPSLLTELLMTGHSEMVETIVSMVIDSVTEQNDMAPAIPLSVLLDSSISREHVSFSEKDLADLTEALTMRSIHLLTPPENLQLVVVARTLLRLKQDSADLDISGTRFMVAARLFEFERVAHQSRRVPQLDEVDIAWALHSSSQSALAHLCFPPSIPDWNAFQALGAGYWLTSVPELRRVVEFIAKNQFVEDRNPLRAMLWYMMLGKKSVFLALLKSSPGQRLMWDFFSRDFNDARWRSAAIKNAFEFVSTRKFWSAIALFILAESLQDAVAVCLRNMHDPQLALVICRLVGGADSPLIAQILKEDILPESVASHNQWMQHIVHWLCGQWEESIQCLTVVDDNASTFRPDVHSLLNAIGKEPPPVLECASGYAQRGWPFLAIVNLLKDRDRYTGHPFLLRFARSALSVRAASSKVLSEDIEGISRFVGLPAEVVRKPLELFQRSHRFFAVDGCLSDILRVMTRVFQSSDLDLAYRYRDSIRDACRAIRSSPTSYRASAALWTGAFLISRHDLALLVRLLRVRSDAMVEAFGEDRSETWSRPNDADPSPIESIVDSPYSDPEIVKVLQRLLECLCLSRMVEILVSKAMPPVDHESYDDVNGLISAMRALCHEMTVDLIHFVRDALDHCRVLTRSGVSLETVLAPLRSPAPLTSPLHHLFVSTDAQRVASCLATDIENVCSTGPFFRPVDIFRLPSELVVGVAFNRCDPSSLAVAVRKSIREINLESALRFRTRSRDSHELLEDELPSWEGCRHRFDSLEERSAAAYDEYMFPVPLLRAHLVLPDVPAALPSSVPVPLGERLFRSSPVYHRMTASVSEDSPLSSVTPDLACSSLIAHPALPVYVSSSQSSLYTWHFGKPRPIAENKVPVDFEGTVTSLRFDRPSLGSRIAVTESNGGAAVYSFDAGTMAPFQAWEAHDRCWTSEFVASPSVVATGGTSKNKTVSNVRLWDLLLPPRQSLVNGFTGRQRGQRGVAALSYVGRRQQLVAGNSAGHLDVFDLRGPPTQPVAHVDKAHHGRITALAFDDLHDAIISGDSDGCVRIWDASTLDLHAEFPALFDARRYFHASFGVTCVDVTASGHLICAGTNGTVKYIRRNDG